MAEAYVTLIAIQPLAGARTAFQHFPFVAYPQGQRQTFTAIYTKRRTWQEWGSSGTGSGGAGV